VRILGCSRQAYSKYINITEPATAIPDRLLTLVCLALEEAHFDLPLPYSDDSTTAILDNRRICDVAGQWFGFRFPGDFTTALQLEFTSMMGCYAKTEMAQVQTAHRLLTLGLYALNHRALATLKNP